MEKGADRRRENLPVADEIALLMPDKEDKSGSRETQGQSLQKVGIDLRQPVFIHGQFYVAFSRVTDMANLDVLLPYRGNGMVENIVYPEVLLR
jgi:hypothetical protein